MRIKRTQLRLPVVAAAFGAATLVEVAPAAAHRHHGHHHSPRTRAVYVSPTGASTESDTSCRHARYSSIQAAIEAAPLGGKVVVCRGTYHEMVTVDRRLTLTGQPRATIDATGNAYGIGVSASYSTVRGLRVRNASPLDPQNGKLADGIVTAGLGPNGPVVADHVRIIGNVVTGNLGNGIDLMSTTGSVAFGNVANGNGVGINVADDLGKASSHNRISHNITNQNFGGCGIALASHAGFGVTDNVVDHNVANDNGLSTPTAPDASAGSGVILASPVPNGVVTGNTITMNAFKGNGHGGVVVHAHVSGSDFSGNVISKNLIGTNNVRTDENDLQTTGIYLGSAAPLMITVTGNVIHDDYYGIFASGPVTITGGTNHFRNVTTQLGTFPTF
jgi:parallel beta-helix repeat protein